MSSTANEVPGRPPSTLVVRLHRLLRRYEPVVAAFAVMFVIVQLTPPFRRGAIDVSDVAPFVAVSPGTVSAESSDDEVLPSPSPGGDATTPSATPAEATAVPAAAPAASVAPEPSSSSPASPPSPPVTVFARLPAPGGAGGVAVASDGTVIATMAGERPRLARYGADGTPTNVIDLTAGSGLSGVVARRAGTAFVLSTSPPAVLHVDLATGATQVHAAIPDVAPCLPLVRGTGCDASAIDRPPLPWAASFDPDGNLFVSDAGQGAIWRIGAGSGRVTQWLVDPAFARLDRPSGPTGVAVDGAGNIVFAVPATTMQEAGVVFIQEVRNDGSAGGRRTLATLAAGEHPAGLGLARSGRVLLSLPDSQQLVVLDQSGRELRRTTIDRAHNAGALSGLVFHGTNVLLAGRTSAGGATTAIVKVLVGEPGGHHPAA
jgi:hypothetical protein